MPSTKLTPPTTRKPKPSRVPSRGRPPLDGEQHPLTIRTANDAEFERILSAIPDTRTRTLILLAHIDATKTGAR